MAGSVTAGGPAALTISKPSRSLRRTAGPIAWTVLEELTLEATNENGELVVTTSVRHLAAELGLAKDTVARALSRLRELGHVEPEGQRQEGGRFGGSIYRLHLPEGIDVSDETTGLAAAAVPGVSPAEGRGAGPAQRQAPRPRSSDQPTLFDQSSDDTSTDSSASNSVDQTSTRAPTATIPDQPDALAPEVREAAGVIEGEEYLPC